MRNLLSTTQILRRVFFPPLETTRTQFLRPRTIPTRTQLRLSSNSADVKRSKEIIDENIQAPFVQLVNAQGKLEPPTTLRDALNSFERPGNYLLQVSPGSFGKPPICKVINRKEKYQHERSMVKDKQAKKRAEPKKLELNWAIDHHDLSHRLKQLANFLDKGRKVDIALVKKKGKRWPTKDETQHVMDSVKRAIEEAGAVEHKPMEGEPGRMVLMYVKRKDT